MTDETTITMDGTASGESAAAIQEATPPPAATVPSTTAKPVLMKRDHRKGGKGVTKIYVNPEQVADFKAAGWYMA